MDLFALTIGMIIVVSIAIYAIYAMQSAKGGVSRDGKFVCKRCEARIDPATKTPGSLGVELAVWIICAVLAWKISGFAIILAAAYMLWRVSAKSKVCPSCGSAELIPRDSPAARTITDR